MNRQNHGDPIWAAVKRLPTEPAEPEWPDRTTMIVAWAKFARFDECPTATWRRLSQGERDYVTARAKKLLSIFPSTPSVLEPPDREALGKIATQAYYKNQPNHPDDGWKPWEDTGDHCWRLGFSACLEAHSSGAKIPWCPECGPFPDMDDDGCCTACGATTGEVPTVVGQEAIDEVFRNLELAEANAQEAKREREQMKERIAELERKLAIEHKELGDSRQRILSMERQLHTGREMCGDAVDRQRGLARAIGVAPVALSDLEHGRMVTDGAGLAEAMAAIERTRRK